MGTSNQSAADLLVQYLDPQSGGQHVIDGVDAVLLREVLLFAKQRMEAADRRHQRDQALLRQAAGLLKQLRGTCQFNAHYSRQLADDARAAERFLHRPVVIGLLKEPIQPRRRRGQRSIARR